MNKRAITIGLLALVTGLVGCATSGRSAMKSGGEAAVIAPEVKAWDDKKEVRTLAFGSCLRQDRPAPIVGMIAKSEPDVFVFLGDNIYGDTEDVNEFRQKYRQLLNVPGMRELRKQSVVLAIWDDHDYGENDAGEEYPQKEMSKREFLKFWGEPKETPRWERDGVYDAKVFGPEGKRVQVILLDTRYNRSPIVELPERGTYGPYTTNNDPKSTILGERQWAWLERELQKPAEVRVIASSIQVLPNEHNWEKWGNYPHERDRLLRLLGKASGAVVILSGDRHSGELSQLDLPGTGGEGTAERDGGGKRLIDVTSSALNQGDGLPKTEPNALRVGQIVTEPHVGWLNFEWEKNRLGVQLRRESGSVIVERRFTFRRLRGEER